MLTDIIHTITYTLDTKMLPPYDAFQRFMKGFNH